MAATITNILVSIIAFCVLAAIAGVVVLTALAATGSVSNAEGCRSDVADAAGQHEVRGVNSEGALADAWQTKWQAFDAQLDAGQPATVSFTESEATSRAQRFLDSKESPVKNLKICFHEGAAEATGNVGLPILADLPGIGDSLDSNVRARGTIDFSGTNPRIAITEIEAGNLPAEAAERLKGRIEGVINDRLDDLLLQHKLSAKLTEGSIEISGTP
jgi:hypothetical protein